MSVKIKHIDDKSSGMSILTIEKFTDASGITLLAERVGKALIECEFQYYPRSPFNADDVFPAGVQVVNERILISQPSEPGKQFLAITDQDHAKAIAFSILNNAFNTILNKTFHELKLKKVSVCPI
ncbi:MAG: hypothetical protein GY818_06960 [Planctomycetaceae bacterium]|nr:hypothetical protein [Planctomycetaceae bacterium]